MPETKGGSPAAKSGAPGTLHLARGLTRPLGPRVPLSLARPAIPRRPKRTVAAWTCQEGWAAPLAYVSRAPWGHQRQVAPGQYPIPLPRPQRQRTRLGRRGRPPTAPRGRRVPSTHLPEACIPRARRTSGTHPPLPRHRSFRMRRWQRCAGSGCRRTRASRPWSLRQAAPREWRTTSLRHDNQISTTSCSVHPSAAQRAWIATRRVYNVRCPLNAQVSQASFSES